LAKDFENAMNTAMITARTKINTGRGGKVVRSLKKPM
jgi:hypothetical protein